MSDTKVSVCVCVCVRKQQKTTIITSPFLNITRTDLITIIIINDDDDGHRVIGKKKKWPDPKKIPAIYPKSIVLYFLETIEFSVCMYSPNNNNNKNNSLYPIYLSE